VAVLGNFDGLHRGHQGVIARGAALARDLGAPLSVLTFEPHPRRVFRPDDPPFRLTPLRIKERQLDALGVDVLVIAHFDAAFLHRSAENFVSEVLVGGLAARHVVAGDAFRFGHGRQGDMALLARLGREHGFDVTGVGLMLDEDGVALSSTRVRKALEGGRPREAAAVLGRAWEIEGRVEVGDRLGHILGFATANLSLADYLRPALGVYAVRAGIDSGQATQWRDGVANLGRRPTLDGQDERLEVHLFDVDEDLYGRHLRVRLIDYLRPERRFATLEALKAQIAVDVGRARDLLAAS
jgi:riboflavin kinase/FMN adenylyltransferase